MLPTLDRERVRGPGPRLIANSSHRSQKLSVANLRVEKDRPPVGRFRGCALEHAGAAPNGLRVSTRTFGYEEGQTLLAVVVIQKGSRLSGPVRSVRAHSSVSRSHLFVVPVTRAVANSLKVARPE